MISRQTTNITQGGETGRKGVELALDEIKSEVRRVIPQLTDECYKGQCGKVAVLGGCSEQAGPAYFAAMAALKAGADIAHVFCASGAASTITGYSPELRVHPYLSELTDFRGSGGLSEEGRAAAAESAAAERTTRSGACTKRTYHAHTRARDAGLPRALLLVARELELIVGYPLCLLTPSLNEFRRLASTMGASLLSSHSDRIKKLHQLVSQLQGPILVSKGPLDVVCDTRNTVVVSMAGGARRCSSQGDILCGVLAAFVAWTRGFVAEGEKRGDDVRLEMNQMTLAAFGGCSVTRMACACAHAAKRRSMIASDMLDYIGSSVDLLVGEGEGLNPKP
ncbi:hypothetical protein FOA52_004901 [Chlamydomonas sp. UWO 241]|nr:hypothetical protein FOA52_004901 [Chlamydomonas sp. UWO 241]